MSICTESTRGLREPVLQVLVAARVFLGQRVNLQEKYDYPQFVLPSAEHPASTVFALGLVFAGLTFLVKGPVGFGAGALSGWLRSRPKVLAGIYRFSGLVLLGLGVKLALERRP